MIEPQTLRQSSQESEETEKKVVIAYVDGLNFHGSLKANGWKECYWLDLKRFLATFLREDEELKAVKYFTSIVWKPEKQARQSFYLRALEGSGVEIIRGEFRKTDGKCYAACGQDFERYSEKETDVNIGVQLVTDAFRNRYHTAILLSADSDLSGAINTVKAEKTAKVVRVIVPPRRPSRDLPMHLAKLAHEYALVDYVKLRVNQFTKQVPDKDGNVVTRPEDWRLPPKPRAIA